MSLYTNTNFDMTKYFNPYRVNMEHNDIFIKGIPFVFMTTPMLNLTKENMAASDFLGYLYNSGERNRRILRHLSGVLGTWSPEAQCATSDTLIPIVTNTAISIDIKDTAARTKEVGETFYGYKQIYPGSTVDSIVGDEISIKYLENDDLPIIKMHKAWLEYIEGVRRGIFIPSKDAIDNGYIDFLCSIYYFLTDFSGEKIIYWAKYTGCAPLIVPYSGLGGDFNVHDIPDVTINYSYCHKADFDFSIIRDFNKVSTKNIVGTEFNYRNLNKSGSEKMPSISNDSVVKKETWRPYTISDENSFYSLTVDRMNDGKGFTSPKIVITKDDNGAKTPKLQWK